MHIRRRHRHLLNQRCFGVSANVCLEAMHRGAVAVLDPARLAIALAGRGDDRRIHQCAGLDRDRARLVLRGDSFEQLPVQALRDERAAEADEGGALGRDLPRGEAAETAEACTVLQRLGQLHVR
jgi:hypothetical protein